MFFILYKMKKLWIKKMLRSVSVSQDSSRKKRLGSALKQPRVS